MTDKYPIELNIKLDIDNKKAKINVIKTNATIHIDKSYNNLTKNLLDFDNWDTEVNQVSNNNFDISFDREIKDVVLPEKSHEKSYIINKKVKQYNDLMESLTDDCILSYTYNNIFVLKNYFSPIKYPFKIISFQFSADDYEKFNILSFKLDDKTHTMLSNNFINKFFKNRTISTGIFTTQDEITEIILLEKILKYATDNNLKYFVLLKDYFRHTSDTIKILENINKLYCKKQTRKIIIHSNKSKIIAKDIKLIIIPAYFYEYLLNIISDYNKPLIKIYDNLINKFSDNIALSNNKIFDL